MVRGLTRGKLALVIAALVYAGAVLSIAAWRVREDQASTSDFDDFYLTAQHWIDTGEIVEDYGVHNYLPIFVILMSPFALLPIKAAVVVFDAGALIGFIAVVGWVDRWLREMSPESPPPVLLRVGGAVLLALPYVTGCLVLGQMALYTLLFVALVWHARRNGRDVSAGWWLAVAISTKVYPAILLPLFVLKRRWRLIGAAGVGLIIMNGLVPTVMFGAAEAWRLHRRFFERTVIGQSALRLAVVDSDKMSYTNQSSALVARRLTRPTDSGVDRPDGAPRHINIVTWEDDGVSSAGARPRVHHVLIGFYIVCLGAAMWTARRSHRQTPPFAALCEFAAFLALGLLLSPIVWSFYYNLMYIPVAIAHYRGLHDLSAGRRVTPALVAAAVWWLGIPALAAPTLRMCGYHIAATLIAFVAMLVLASRAQPNSATAQGQGGLRFG